MHSNFLLVVPLVHLISTLTYLLTYLLLERYKVDDK